MLKFTYSVVIMNKQHNIFLELIITILIAGILSVVAYFLAIFVLQLFNHSDEKLIFEANTFSATIFGLAVGYKLNDIIRTRKTDKRTTK